VFALGTESGSALLGVLFNALGTRTTLLIYSMNSGVILVILLLYLRFSKRSDDYEKLPQDTDEE
jgi:predicted MFS family arabinose efflux permease